MKSTILTVGLNHRTAPVEIRERVPAAHCLRHEVTGKFLSERDPSLCPEICVLSTCNRTEIYAVSSDHKRGQESLRNALTGHESFFAGSDDFLYSYADRESAAHLFAVAGGIDSMLVGEFEILGQVREAYRTAAEMKSVGPLLHQLFQQAVNVGKRARSDTAIGAGATSIAYAAVTFAREQLGRLAGLTALVIGAGEMGRRAAKNLSDDGACTVLVASRTYGHALELAREIGCQAIAYDDLGAALEQADLVISATKAPHLILTLIQVAAAMESRPRKPLCLIDIAVPRDIEPEVALLENVRLFNIDDLNELVSTNRAARTMAIDQVRAIVDAEADAFWQWCLSRRAAPVLFELQNRAETIRQAEVERTLRRLSHLNLSERDREAITTLSSSLVSKLLSAPRANLKARMLHGDGQEYLEMLRDIFDLDTVQ